ncbi:4-(cytidine 5'-diphospho)-2-C-methyl-D-erythritol kinase [Colwellia sp. UCD-KL20]|uniref:4-(cytidine 5'-diphospho)-2-C-methyl-D-erythritol kinase n=1 Tax=Colwellia sp. UCD-KL20 TaxID=1917165 RepID=UPI001C4B2461|nr:4-(cytidine 5'-diphospho)-2-C-methyl-D-erythritol kinase [Colwellia sp. UCD-KL20]
MVNTANFISFPSPAKLNLFLHVVGQRPNGYHELETVFQFLDYGDTIELSVNNSNTIELLTPIEGVNNSDNLIFKAAKLLQNQTKCNLGVQIKIHKILPMGGGLGGGSSNAATILLALNKLWDINLPTNQLTELGLSLGADVPIFIKGFAAFAQGIGEVLTPISPTEYWYLVSKPSCSISTQDVFGSPELVRTTPKLLLNENINNQDIDLQIETYHNDCETIVIKNYPKVANLLAWLIEYAPSRMTGTGACIFSRFNSKNEAKKVQSTLPEGIESFIAKGINQSPLIDAIKNLAN